MIEKKRDLWVMAALDYDNDEAYILAKSEDARDGDLIDGNAVSDSIKWNTNGLEPGLYKLTLKPWVHNDYDGFVDAGIVVETAELVTPFPKLAA